MSPIRKRFSMATAACDQLLRPLPALFLLAGLLLTGVGPVACGNAAQKQDSKDVAEDKNDQKFDTKDQEQIASFVVDAVADARETIRLAELAGERSTHSDVKELAAVLKKDHGALLERFKAYAVARNISVPADLTKDARDGYVRLSALSPQQFDRKWCELLMEKHKKKIAEYEAAVTALPDEALKKEVNAVLPPMRQDYDKLMEYHHKL